MNRPENNTASSTLSAFLNHSLSGGGGDWIGGDWKERGELVFWIHPGNDLRAASYFTHSFFRTKTFQKEDEPETTDVRWYQFVCCDPDKTAGRARWYEDDGYRQNPPQVCPIDFLLEWLSVEIVARRLDWKEPVFEFRGDGDEKRNRVLRAGGMLGLFNRKDLSKDEIAELKRARIDRQTAFQQNVTVKGGYLLAVVDDDARDSIQKFAIQGTGAPGSQPALLKDAIARVMKGYSVDNPENGRRINVPPADPIMRPYRFTYVKPEKGFGEYGCNPLNREPDKEVLDLFRQPAPDMSEDRAKGNCLELRMIMEQHCVLKGLPIDSFFEKADKAGLMKPRDEKPKKTHGRAAPTEVRGDAPAKAAQNAAEDETECLNCGKGMPADDLTCRACGATYAEDGDLDGIPCLKCKTVVPVSDQESRFICPKCGVIHSLDYRDNEDRAAGREPVWSAVEDDAPDSDNVDF